MRGRKHMVGDGMDFYKGDDLVSVRFEQFLRERNGISVSVKHGDELRFEPCYYLNETCVHPGISLRTTPIWPLAIIEYLAPGYTSHKRETPYKLHLTNLTIEENDILKISAGGRDIRIVIGRVGRNVAKATIDGIQTKLCYKGNALYDGIILRVPGRTDSPEGKLPLKVYAPKRYYITCGPG